MRTKIIITIFCIFSLSLCSSQTVNNEKTVKKILKTSVLSTTSRITSNPYSKGDIIYNTEPSKNMAIGLHEWTGNDWVKFPQPIETNADIYMGIGIPDKLLGKDKDAYYEHVNRQWWVKQFNAWKKLNTTTP